MRQNTMQLIVLSRGDGLYEKVCRDVSKESMRASVKKARSLCEAAVLMRTAPHSVVVTDDDSLPVVTELIMSAEGEDGFVIPDRGNAEEEVAFIRYYIRMHLGDELNLETLSRKIGLSPNYLCTLFHKETGISIRRFIEKSRLEKAAYLLETEADLIADVGKRVGLPNPSYFSKLFKKFYGETPRRYRASRRISSGG